MSTEQNFVQGKTMYTQTATNSPLPLHATQSISSISDILRYGTDAQCRTMLELVADELGGDSIEELREFKEKSIINEEYKEFYNDVVKIITANDGHVPNAMPCNVLPIVEGAFIAYR